MAQAKATTPEAVLEAAAEVFSEKGYRATTLDDIAARAGVSKPTVYNYAKGKQSLMDRILKKVLDEAQQRGAEIWDGSLPLAERLRRLVVVNVEVALEYQAFFTVAYLEYRESSPQAAREFNVWARATTDRTRSLLAECRDAGLLRLDGDLAIYANLLQSLFASFHRWVRPDGRAGAEEIADHVLRLLASADRDTLLPGRLPCCPAAYRPLTPRTSVSRCP